MSAYTVPRKTATTVTGNATAQAGHHNPADATTAALTLTLPTAVNEGASLSVGKVDSTGNLVTVTGTIDGTTESVTLAYQGETLEFIADAAGSWHVVSNNLPRGSLSATYPSLDNSQRLAIGGAELGPAAIGSDHGGAKVYVSLDGDDNWTGTSWATAKRTIAAAVAALPTYTQNSATYHAGTVEIGVGTFVEQGNLEANSEIRYLGANAMSGQRGTWIQLAAGRNCDVFTYTSAWGAAQNFAHGLTFENLTVDGNAAAQGATTLAAAITSATATSLTVTSATAFPQTGTFDVAIDNEIVTVTTGASTTTWTITRGQYGTVAATHSAAAAVNFSGACIRIFGGGFNCKTSNTHVRQAGIGVRVDGAAVNYVGHDFHASSMYGPAFAYMPQSWASGCMIAFSGTGQIDDCGHDAMYFEGAQNGTCAVSIAAMKFESNNSTVKHQHCIVYKSALQSGSSPSFVIDGVTAYAQGGGRESVIYDYAGTNGQGAAWDMHGVVGTDGYNEAFYSARYGIHTGTQGISSMSVANSENAPGGGVLGAVHLGTSGFYSGPYTANPNSNITAARGALYEYTGGSVPNLWVKTVDGGNTGWVPFQAVASGATASRPTGVPSGWQFFDTTLGKPIWLSTGTTWVDATGATV